MYDDEGPPPAGADRRARRALRVRRRAGRGRPGERLPVDRARHRHRVRRVGHAGASTRTTMQSTRARRVLRRRRGVRAEEHHLGGRARPRRGDLDRPALPRRGRRRAPAAARQPDVAEDGHPRVELRQRRSRSDPRYKVPLARTSRSALQEHQGRGRARLRRRDRLRRKRSAASTATCRRCSPTSCASSATPASTSARWTASPSPPTATRPTCARGCRRRR